MGLNYVHETAHSLYIKHVYNGTDANTYLGADLFETYRIVPVEERVDGAVKRVQKLTASARTTLGQPSRGGNSSGRHDGGRRGGNNFNGNGQQYGRHNAFSYDHKPSAPLAFGRYGNGNGSFDGNNGGYRGNGGSICFICGSTSHLAMQCSKG